MRRLPRRAPAGAADEAVCELAPWIERRRGPRSRGRQRRSRALPARCRTWGPSCRLLPQPGRTRVHCRGDLLLVPKTGRTEALERWYRRAARTELVPRLDAAVARVGTTYTRLTIRGQRTRWVWCSATGAMSFNWRLLLAPAQVLDYVIEHEVCHLEMMDHSPPFWRLLESRVPDWRAPPALAAPLRLHARALNHPPQDVVQLSDVGKAHRGPFRPSSGASGSWPQVVERRRAMVSVSGMASVSGIAIGPSASCEAAGRLTTGPGLRWPAACRRPTLAITARQR